MAPATDEPAADNPATYNPSTYKPAAEKPAAEKPATEAASSASSASPRKLRFQFHFQPWKDALEWFAQQAGLSLVADAPPPGTLNYYDDREYTPAEALDLLNGVLLTKGYTLVRRERMLMLINLEDGIPPNLVETITPEALDGRGEYELVSVLFNLKKLNAEEAAAEIQKLLGPQGSAVPLAKARQLLVTETAGRLRAIRAILMRIEEVADQKDSSEDDLVSLRPRMIPVHNAQAQEVAEIVRQVYADRMIEGMGTMRSGTGRMTTTQLGEMTSGAPNMQQRGGGQAGQRNEELPRMSVGVDARTNSLVVVALGPLFEEVKQLVEKLDMAAGDQDQTTRVVSLRRVTPEALQQAVSTVAGDLAQFGAHTRGIASGVQGMPGQPLPQLPSARPRSGFGGSRPAAAAPESAQGAGASFGQAPRIQPSRSPYSRGRSGAPNSAPVQ
jgi:type II secretory pathway component GspD/PulD (secretin)